MPLFGSSKKNPAEIAKNLRDSLLILEKDEQGKKSEKVLTHHNVVFMYLYEKGICSHGCGANVKK